MSQYTRYIPLVGINEKKLLQMCSVEQLRWFAVIDQAWTEDSKRTWEWAFSQCA